MIVGPGTRLGSYDVLSAIGAGGMGEVYRARDTKLGRDVAIKIVHPRFGDNPEHMARFRREAHVLASLNHPHIAAIFEFDEVEGVAFLVMELVEGETLHERLSAGSLHLSETLDIFGQVAAALEAAHDKGIIHRDLKPANIKITPEGVVKVLDFGLAKALSGHDSGTKLSQPPTGTAEGMILGTASYMSPEQARGRPVDRRADIWAFGCVMFEALTNSRPFAGDTVSDTIASILEREPDWQRLPATTPVHVRHLLRRCLQKDVNRRLRDIGDARLYIEDAQAAPDVTESSVSMAVRAGRTRRLWRSVALVALGGVAGATAGLLLNARPAVPPRPAAHFIVSTPPSEKLAGLDFPAVAISPDGSLVTYVATRGGRPQLFVRRMNSLDSAPLAGTADATGPFFSPDSRWIAFFAAGKLKKVPTEGGAVADICDVPIGFGGSWGRDDIIVFAPTTGSGLSQVAGAGGTPTRATTLDTKQGEFSHRWPEILPDGRTVVFTVGTVGSWDDARIVAQSLGSDERRVLIQGGTHPHYVPSGHLVFARGGAVMAVEFDAARLEVKGTPVRVLDNVLQSFDGAAQLSVSPAGSLAFVPGSFESTRRQLLTVDRTGAVTPLAGPNRVYASPRMSPEGRRLLVTIANATEDLWVYDMAQGTLNQLTFDANNASPVWTPDGRRVVFSSSRGGASNIFWIPIDGGAEERLVSSDNAQVPGSWSPDGRTLAFVERNQATGRDIWLLPLEGDRKPRAWLTSPFDETSPRFSPDGRSIAYVSNGSGQNEVHVADVRDPSRTRQVSSGGGAEPVWAPNGRELFYRAGDRMMAAGADGAAARALFEGAFDKGTLDAADYDVTADGQRFIMVKTSEDTGRPSLHVVLNWVDSLAKPDR